MKNISVRNSKNIHEWSEVAMQCMVEIEEVLVVRKIARTKQRFI